MLKLVFIFVIFSNILFRAMAFVKRLSICASWSSPSIAAGFLFLISGILTAKPSLLKLIQQKSEDVPSVLDPDKENIHDDASDAGSMMTISAGCYRFGPYDAAKREPEFATATAPSLWELSLLRHHFHPSVQTFTNSLLTPPKHEILFDGDPIASFSNMVRLISTKYILFLLKSNNY